MSKFSGPAFDGLHDQERLERQITRIKNLMLDGVWRSYTEIALATSSPPTSVSSQLRNLRMKENGPYIVERRTRGDRKRGLYEYRVTRPLDMEKYLKDEVERRSAILDECEARLQKAREEYGDAVRALEQFAGNN